MALAFNTIKSARGADKKRKRIGRGNASGHGTYSTRGLKGQRSRSGVSNLKRLGFKQILASLPKKRGFRSKREKFSVVNLSVINKRFVQGEEVSVKTLFQKGLLSDPSAKVKILGKDELSAGFNFKGVAMSKSAAEAVAKAGGKIL